MRYDLSHSAPEMPMQISEQTTVGLPADTSASRPTLTVSMGAHYRIHESGSHMSEETVAAMQQLGSTTTEQLNAAANMSIALYGAAHAKGFDVDICIDAAPTVDIFLGHDVLGTHPDMTIGTDVIVTDEDGD